MTIECLTAVFVTAIVASCCVTMMAVFNRKGDRHD
jgi:hypothetical protein